MSNAFEEIREDLLTLLEERKFPELQEHFLHLNAVDIAEFLNELSAHDAAIIFRMLPKSSGAEVFSRLDQSAQANLIDAYTDNEIEEIIEGLYNDDLVDMLEEVPANVAKRLLKNTARERRVLVNRLLQYPEDSAGSIMTTEYLRLNSDMTVREAIQKIRKSGEELEMIYTCYVTKNDRVLEGVVSLREILTAQDDLRIVDLMHTNVIYATTHDDQEDATRLLNRYDFLALPVVDSENRLVGIITVDDAMYTISEETSEDISLMAAVQPSEKPYLETSVIENTKHRVLWLLILMISGMLNGMILANYEHVFVSLPILVSFIPMLTDTGGNAGSQASGLLIRAMALGEVSFSDIGLVLWRELRIGLLVGAILAFVNGLRIYLMNDHDLVLAITVSLALLFAVVLAKIIAGSLPLLAKLCKLDPALMAAPLITTLVDAMALVIYFTIAKLLLPI